MTQNDDLAVGELHLSCTGIFFYNPVSKVHVYILLNRAVTIY